MIRTASRMLCIWFPRWPIQRFVVARPDLKLRGQILVLHREDPRRGFIVSACSPRAFRVGVREGMPLTEASALLRKAPARRASTSPSSSPSSPSPARSESSPEWTMRIERHDEAADEQVLRELAVEGEVFSPLVGYRTTCPVSRKSSSRTSARRAVGEASDCLYWDITRSRHVFGGEESLVREVLAWLRDLGYFPHAAVADTIGAAWALAHYAKSSSPPPSTPSTAPPTAHSQSHFVFAAAGAVAEALGPLPVEALRLSAGPRDRLYQLGITRVEQLLALPRAALAARLGPEVLERIDLCLGHREETIEGEQAAADLVAEQYLEHATAVQSSLEQVVRRLLRTLAVRLREQQQGAMQVRGHFQCAEGPRWSWEIGMYAPSDSEEHWWELIRIQFENLRLPDAVEEVRVEVPRAAPLVRHQAALFDNGARYAPRDLAFLLDRLSSRLGREAILGVHSRRDPLPERAFGFHPLTGNTPLASRRGGLPRSLDLRPPSAAGSRRSSRTRGRQPLHWEERPLRLHSKPIPLEVLAVAPDGPPIRFRGPRGASVAHVTQWWGPERIETGWWRGPSVRRDYYRVQVHSGYRFWIFRRRRDGRWFLHGEY